MMVMQYMSKSPEETERIGEMLARELKPGDVVAYEGGLGAGKTAFTRGLARASASQSLSPAPPIQLSTNIFPAESRCSTLICTGSTVPMTSLTSAGKTTSSGAAYAPWSGVKT